jgi:DNA-binding PadR family transcriptional regulator
MLTGTQYFWLNKMSESGKLSAVYDKPPKIVMRNLTQKGYCRNIMDTFYEITPEGREAILKW